MLLVWSRLECSGEGNRYLELSEVPPFTCSTWLCKSLVRILPCRSLSASSLDQMVDMGDASSPLFRGIILSNTLLAVFDTLFILGRWFTVPYLSKLKKDPAASLSLKKRQQREDLEQEDVAHTAGAEKHMKEGNGTTGLTRQITPFLAPPLKSE